MHSLYRCRRHNKISANRQLLDVPTIRLICNRVIFIAVTEGGGEVGNRRHPQRDETLRGKREVVFEVRVKT